MRERKNNTVVVALCRVLFVAFSFVYLYSFQGDLLGAAHGYLSQGRTAGYNCLISSIVITLLAVLLEWGTEKLIKYKGYVYASNYIPSAFLLGFMTRFDGKALLGDTVSPVIWVAVLCAVAMIICKVVQTGIMVEKRETIIPVASNLFLLSLIMGMVPVLGNTEENWHRSLKIEHLLRDGHAEEALLVGRYESESDRTIDLLRAKAMLMLDTDTLAIGTAVADRLFGYSISERTALARELRSIEDSDTVNMANNLTLVSYMLEKQLDRFVSEFDVYAWNDIEMPRYFLQALVMADSLGMEMSDMSYVQAQKGYDKAVEQYSQFASALRTVQDDPVRIRANSLFLEYHETYYWFYRFAR